MRKPNCIKLVLTGLLIAFAVNAAAEENPHLLQQVYSVKISSGDLKVSTAAEMITAQTGVAFSYSEEVGNVQMGGVKVSLRNAELDTILSSVFSDAGIGWVVVDNMIGLYQKEEKPVFAGPVASEGKVTVQQQHEPAAKKGTVTDTHGSPIPGAAVLVKGTARGVQTDGNGVFSISVNSGDILVCQCIGYKTQELVVPASGAIQFILEEDNQLLEETVIVGYGTLKKAQLVGSVENLSGDILEDRSNANVARSLQGEIAGLNIIQVDGKPTHSGEIYIRGNATSYQGRSSFANSGKTPTTYSIGTGGSALVLIDGVEGDLASVNPTDIETVAVLKDASSAAIYGAKGAYGVILVTTKNAKNEKFSITYSSAYSFNSRIVKWEDNIVTDGLEWTEAFWEFFQNQTRVPGGSGKNPTTINKFDITLKSGNYLDSFRERREAGNFDIYGGIGKKGQYIYYASENYAADIYRRNSHAVTHDLSIKGNSERFTYSLSGRYQTQDGIYKVGKEDFQKLNIRVKSKLRILDWLSVDNNTFFDYDFYVEPMWTASGAIGKQIDLNGQPVVPIFNEDGTYTRVGAVSSYGALNDGNTGQRRNIRTLTTSTGLNLDLIKNVLTLRGDFTYKTQINLRQRYQAPLQYSDTPGVMTDQTSQSASYKTNWENVTDHITANLLATWTPKWGKNHDLNAVAGINLEDYRFKSLSIQRKGMLFPDKLNSFELFDGTDYSVSEYDRSYGILGAFTRINYTLLRRYIFEVSARYDGSSIFPSRSRWGLFPSGSIGWRVSEEPWMGWSRNWLDNLKIRANYGTLGNGAIAPYTFLETMGIDKTGIIIDGQKVNYSTEPSVIPTDLTWERVTTYDVGVDMDLFKSRLSFSGDIYVRNTDDLITTGYELPQFYGASAPIGNFASLQAKGWEFTVSWRDHFKLAGKDFNWQIKGSLWDTRTFVTKYTTLSENVLDFYTGKELGEMWGFRTDGYFLSNQEADAWVQDTFHRNGNLYKAYAGDLKFLDLNGDNAIDYGKGTLEDHGDIDVIGNVTPRYQFGINLGFNWAGFGVSAFIQGIGKRDWYPPIETALFYGMYNRVYSGWFPKNQTGDNYCKIDYSTDNWVVTNADKNPYWTRRVGYAAYYGVSVMAMENDYYLLNAAYVRLKNLTVDYTLPAHILQKAKIQRARIYLSMENLWTWSPLFKYTENFDPEGISVGDTDFSSATQLNTVGAGYSYPMLKSFTLGINLTF